MARNSKSSSVLGTRIALASLYAVTAVVILVATIYLVRAFDSRSQLALGPEHRVRFASEFTADQESELDPCVVRSADRAVGLARTNCQKRVPVALGRSG